MEKELVCIVCPKGCRMKIEANNDSVIVRGNGCKRGETYAIKEMSNPTRVLTSTVVVKYSDVKRLPVKTKGEIPKELMFKSMEIVNKIEVSPPIRIGDVIIENILDTGIDVVACKSII